MSSVEIKLRPATLADLELLQYWDQQPHVLAATDDDWEWGKNLAFDPDWREQLIAELNGRAIGFVQIINAAREESHYWGEVAADVAAIDIWIGEADCLGQGYGTEMMRQAIARCFADPTINTIYIDPLVTNTRAHRFYERLGFQFLEQRNMQGDECYVYQLPRPV